LENKLKLWRHAEAQRRKIPAFCIFGNRTLRAIALERPTTPRALLAVSGIGPAKLDKFGAAVCRLCAQADAEN
jgi:superfamily II DNA helicase RecQ